MAKLKIVVDWNLCVGHGQCEFAAPEVFTIDDEGKLKLDETPDESLRAKVEQAIRRCPTRALSLASECSNARRFSSSTGAAAAYLLAGRTRSCGCLRAEQARASIVGDAGPAPRLRPAVRFHSRFQPPTATL